jgi:hypothetical protein
VASQNAAGSHQTINGVTDDRDGHTRSTNHKGWNGQVADFDKLPQVFAENATCKSEGSQVDVTGRDVIVAMLREQTAGVTFAMHSFTNPSITIDGDTASANWLLWVAVNADGTADQVYQDEDLTYTHTPDGWRIQSIELHFGQTLK